MSSRLDAIDLTISRLTSRSTAYFALMGVAFLLSSVQTLVFARYLSATSLGLFATASSVALFGVPFQLGLLSGLTRELPVALGAGLYDQADRLVGSVTWAMMALGSLVLPVYLAVVFFVLPDHTAAIDAALALGGVWSVSRVFGDIVLLRLRSERALVSYPVTLLLQRTLTISLGAIAASRLDFEAVLVVFIGVDITTYLVMSFFRLRRVDYRWPLLSDLKYLVSIGFPMMLAGVVRNGQLSGEKLFIVTFMSASDLGIYQVAWVPLGAAIALNGVVTQFLGPKVLQEYGGHRSLWRVFKESSKVSFGLLGLGLAAAPFAMVLLGPLVDHFVGPDFADSANAMRVLYFSGVLLVGNMFHMVMLAANRPWIVLRLQIVVSLVTIGAYAIVVNTAADIVWVAVVNTSGMALDFFMRFAIAWWIARDDENARWGGVAVPVETR